MHRVTPQEFSDIVDQVTRVTRQEWLELQRIVERHLEPHPTVILPGFSFAELQEVMDLVSEIQKRPTGLS